jgi:hypothetical protein
VLDFLDESGHLGDTPVDRIGKQRVSGLWKSDSSGCLDECALRRAVAEPADDLSGRHPMCASYDDETAVRAMLFGRDQDVNFALSRKVVDAIGREGGHVGELSAVSCVQQCGSAPLPFGELTTESRVHARKRH